MYKIFWTNLNTNQTGQSLDKMSLEIANAWIKKMNNKYPYIIHTLI